MVAAFKLWLFSLFTSGGGVAVSERRVYKPLEYMSLRQDGDFTNPLMIQFFTWDTLHDTLSWWKHLEQEIPRLAEQGFTQIWLPPASKAEDPNGRGYDVYDLWDLGEFERNGVTKTRWGTREELLSATRAAREHGIDILIDAVLNHKLGADRTEVFTAVPVSPTHRMQSIGPERQIEGWTAFDFPGRGDKYSSFKWNSDHFTGLDWDQKTETKGVFRITGPGHQGWSRNVDNELGNYDYLLGVDPPRSIIAIHPFKRTYSTGGTWILETTGASGFRLDAIKHYDRKFLLEWIRTVKQRIGNPKLFSVAEYWSGNVNLVLRSIAHFEGEVSFFDVPFHENLHAASRGRQEYDLRKILQNTVVQVQPGAAVTFVDNHDTVCGVLSSPHSLASWVGAHFKVQAYALVLLRASGHPCVFYGDLYPNKQYYDATVGMNLKLLVEARKKFAYGAEEVYLAERNAIGFVRRGDVQGPGLAVVLSNKDDPTFVHEVRMNMGIANAGKVYRNFLANDKRRVQLDNQGWGSFACQGGSAFVWIEEGTY
ncbi:alpha amylase [Coprinopsis sp. MPI-PUGE-AT-0042]|nr:alpha amylase [Coprinopsis sp. MPI-PUGE-AT-0042]